MIRKLVEDFRLHLRKKVVKINIYYIFKRIKCLQTMFFALYTVFPCMFEHVSNFPSKIFPTPS